MEGREEPAFLLQDYDYELPSHLIAQVPCSDRDACRLLVLPRSGDPLEHCRFNEIGKYFLPGDLLVLNDTRVVPARLHGTKETGGKVELLVAEPYKDSGNGSGGYGCLVKSSKPLRKDCLISLQDGTPARIVSSQKDGMADVCFLSDEPLLSLLGRIGQVPLPPYIRREGEQTAIDDGCLYQTVYARQPGAVAAPTAGLHFTGSMLKELEAFGVETAAVTLHVGYGTFAPIRSEDIRAHRIHEEYVEVSSEAAEQIERARSESRRIIAVGTTVVRTLEWVASQRGSLEQFSGFCRHYIYPGVDFRVVTGMITNFHLPKSTLMLLVSALAGRQRVLQAYREAVAKEYRFFSYGDAMLIL
jgi:S-adenosylmethionine:tRNA ribosyltransferase-isomerase